MKHLNRITIRRIHEENEGCKQVEIECDVHVIAIARHSVSLGENGFIPRGQPVTLTESEIESAILSLIKTNDE